MPRKYFFPILIILVLFSIGLLIWENALYQLPPFLKNPQLTSSEIPKLPSTILQKPILRTTDPVLGNQEAPLAIVVFSDFKCPFCAQMASILKELLKKYPQKVKLIWKDAPNPNSSQALLAAEAAKCAQEQGKFWEYHDLLFANQNYLSPSLYLEMARQLNLDASRFETCLQSKKWDSIIQASLAEAQALGINGTPYLFIGDKRRISGRVSLEELEKIIQEIK